MDSVKQQGKVFLAFACLFFLFSILGSGLSYAAVTGLCGNCHTMHNSQDGSPLVRSGTDAGWGGSGIGLTGATSQKPMSQLLVTGCVGCHTSTTADTIVTYGGSEIPIVYNTAEPTDPLAGGNFYWVSQSATNDGYGHNVYGISAQDSKLATAPGRTTGAMCGNSCHDTLAAAPNVNNKQRGGCQGCHLITAHHDDSKPWYRFLKGHGNWPGDEPDKNTTDYVVKTATNEDPDWEQVPATGHNKYKGAQAAYDSDGTALTERQSITAFCSGCHAIFHNTAKISSGGYASPWLRHPTDIALPNTGEYAGYNPVSSYSAEAPVAWTNPEDTSDRATAVVMCLSCHRVHGSDQPDMLRWDYSTMNVGEGGTGGCFTCHTYKN